MECRTGIVAMLFAISGCSLETCSSESAMNDKLAHDLPRLSRELALPLPSDTKVVWVQHEEGMDDMTRAKLTMRATTFAELAPQLPLKPEELTAGPGELGPNYEGWNPEATPGIRSGEAKLEGGRFLHFGYAKQGDQVTLFVVNFGT